MKREVTKLISVNDNVMQNVIDIMSDGVRVQVIDNIPYLGKLKLPYTLTTEELDTLKNAREIQLKLTKLVYPVTLKEVIYNNGTDRALSIRGEQDGIVFRTLVITTTLTVEQQAKIQAFHDFASTIKPGFDTLQWYPPTTMKVDDMTINTDSLGQSGNDMVVIIGECLKEILIENCLS